MFDLGDAAFERIDRNAWWLRIGVCLALPAMFATYGNPTLSGLAQTVYAWTMIFGLIRLFRMRFPGENPKIRYLADSSYWLYLAHLPLVVAAQSWISPWNLPSGMKFLGLTACTTALLLVSYQILVRHTWIGRLLNGPRQSANSSAKTT
jgi:peptidoglycan/LPS O-acetylase OafA/YrhL